MHRALRGSSGFVATLLSAFLLPACSGSPTAPPPPPPDPGAPVITCPESVSIVSPLGNPIAVAYGPASVTGGSQPLAGPTCTPASGSIFNPGANQVGCTVTDAKQRSATCTFAVTVKLPPRLTVTRLLAFGDSITWGENGSSASPSSSGAATRVRPAVQYPLADTYPGALQGALVSRYTLQSPTVANAGLPSESVTDRRTFPRFTSLTSSRQFDAVLIMEGSNDLADRDARIEPAVIAGLGQMIDDVNSRGLRPFLATLPPENPNGFRGLAWSLIPGFNDQIRQLAASKGVPLVDVYLAFGGDLSKIGFDGLHPTTAGYHLIADTFFAVLKQNLEQPPTGPTGTPSRVPPSFVLPRRR